MSEKVTPARTYVIVYITLLALLAATYSLSYVDLGELNTGVAFAIAGLKAALILVWFMHLKHATGLTRVLSGVGVFWFGILVMLTLTDYLSRGWLEAPGHWPGP